ncbi:hypothetical protein RHMOL_Rhmol10G0139800 [Rhododendron molle]|uniref:Uncharacterized protein n=1 Tax=Rhododendron molle TaxID=49168 RepID=A0ACC0M3S1_RHOML|nr:hypothetical protein RHMOL_Rhmol10G0139800 [Rhododendron molle]
METLQEDVRGLRIIVKGLVERVDAMSDVEKTIRMLLIVNWDKHQGPPPAFPSPPCEAKGSRWSGSK